MATPTEFFNATLPEEIPIPDWTHLNIPQLPTLKLRWDEIYINDALNTSKVEAHTPAEIQRIKLSFAEKVDIKEYPSNKLVELLFPCLFEVCSQIDKENQPLVSLVEST